MGSLRSRLMVLAVGLAQGVWPAGGVASGGGLMVVLLTSMIARRVEAQALYKLEVNENTAQGIYVVVLQGDGYAMDNTLVKYNGTIAAPGLLSYTFCHRFQLFYHRPRMYLTTYAYTNEDTNELYSEYHLGRSAFRVCKRGTKYCAWHREMPQFEIFRHICITYDHFRDVYKLYVDGEKVDSGSFAGDNPVQAIRPGGIFVVGQDQDELDGAYNKKQSWSGTVTQYNLWDFSIEDYDIENMAECRSDVLGNIVRWDQPFWEERNIETKRMATFELCNAEEGSTGGGYFLFPDLFDFYFYNSFCINLGGKMPETSSEEQYHEMMDITEDLIHGEIHEKCMHASGNIIIWVAGVDDREEGVWEYPNSDPRIEIPYGFWESGQPNGGAGENCIRTYIDRRWQDKACDSAICAICQFEKRMNLTMRGLCNQDTKLMEGSFDTEYFILGFRNKKPHWRGLGKSHIYYLPRKKSWRMESFYEKTKFADLPADDTVPVAFYPLGRKRWKVRDGICQLDGDTPRAMTLTNCLSGIQFTCDEGTCVRMNQRCNLVNDCPDSSDEKDCDILQIAEDYRRGLFPRAVDNQALPVYINVSVLSFPKIETLELSFTADFILSLRWVDPRLTFYDLRGSTDLNSLSKDLQAAIWYPSVGFTNAKLIGGSKVDKTTSTNIQRTGSPAPDDIQRSLEANVYSGLDSNINMRREYFIDWTCDYDLLYYPFDTQVCKMLFELSGATIDYIVTEVDTEGVEYLGKKALLEYVIGDMMLKTLNNETDEDRKYAGSKVSFFMTRRWFYHAISVFLQSVLLLIVAYMTFYYRIDNFEDRVMVSITCMLVIANVQSSINVMVPKTSYFKMIDYFLLYSFNIIIVVMVYHTYQAAHINENFSPNEDDKAMEKVKRLGPTGHNGGNDKEKLWNTFFVEEGAPVDKLAEARRINNQGKVIFVVAFFIFQTIFWSVALAENLSTKDVYKLTELSEYYEALSKKKTV